VVVLRADNGQPDWYILSGAYGDAPRTVSMAYRLPSGFTCTSGCTLQWEYMTYNTCMEVCDRRWCGAYAATCGGGCATNPAHHWTDATSGEVL